MLEFLVEEDVIMVESRVFTVTSIWVVLYMEDCLRRGHNDSVSGPRERVLRFGRKMILGGVCD